MTEKEKNIITTKVMEEYYRSQKLTNNYKRILYNEKDELLQFIFYREPFMDVLIDEKTKFSIHISLVTGHPCGWTQFVPINEIKTSCPEWLN